MKKWIAALLTCLVALPTWAGQFKEIKDTEVHYVALSSTFLTPQVAKSYGLKRSEYSAIVNISVLDKSRVGKPALTATVKGQAKNLLGQIRTLTFKEIREGEAIYYIAELPVNHEESLTFDLDINAGLKGAGKLTFTQKFYIEE
ncbi:hypothetical protein BOO30_01445 [Vibrio navarrensis]|jgi:hypothetical protein|uniref:DUF4426 domain-containing protein n=2 Tax=Vibrio TaxID=662 RepID=A0A099MQM7_9VIBR|nr:MULTISPECIES: DUF4426 domain-containing protein [Vibrio]EGR2794937.1 DUF4426 domain-containing protein [Vibrio navarrensis]EJK2115009.1 DUF4426 domain-containing protein [Vibrio navarrensis]EJL6397514.1 DUF4426 domain-containing protein [Vibrio navarrensis]EJL6564851.1 DUF4426 domain-containing protein [Vibrio navarrensis]EJN6829667.1 DUF4426 domain-containing protein [Vibrio cidicii]